MKAIKLGPDGDLLLKTNPGGGIDFDIVENEAEAEQAIRIHLLTRQGEELFDPAMGLPVPEIVGLLDESFIEGSIRAALQRDPRVDAVGDMEMELDPKTRVVTVSFSVRLKDGGQVAIQSKIGG